MNEKYGKSHSNHHDYTVTRDGEVYSWKTGKPVRLDGTRGKSSKIYSIDGEKHSAHWLVMTIWGPDPIEHIALGRKIYHLDQNFMNNDLDNLCYATQSEYVEFLKWWRPLKFEIQDLQQRVY